MAPAGLPFGWRRSDPSQRYQNMNFETFHFSHAKMTKSGQVTKRSTTYTKLGLVFFETHMHIFCCSFLSVKILTLASKGNPFFTKLLAISRNVMYQYLQITCGISHICWETNASDKTMFHISSILICGSRIHSDLPKCHRLLAFFRIISHVSSLVMIMKWQQEQKSISPSLRNGQKYHLCYIQG